MPRGPKDATGRCHRQRGPCHADRDGAVSTPTTDDCIIMVLDRVVPISPKI
jgi:hypothetical protein